MPKRDRPDLGKLLAAEIYEWFKSRAGSGFVIGPVDEAAIEDEFDLTELAAFLADRPSLGTHQTPV